MYFSGNLYIAEPIITMVMNDRSIQILNLFPIFTAIFIRG